MVAFINALYRDYCFARLQEMRKHELANQSQPADV